MYENWHSGSEIYTEIKNVCKNQDTLKDEQRAIVISRRYGCPGFSSCCFTEIDVPIDLRWVSRETWRAAVDGVARIWTRLGHWTTTAKYQITSPAIPPWAPTQQSSWKQYFPVPLQGILLEKTQAEDKYVVCNILQGKDQAFPLGFTKRS